MIQVDSGRAPARTPADSRRLTTEPELVAVEQAAAVLSIGRTKVYELIASGELRTVHIGKSCRIARDEIRRFVAQLSGDAEAIDKSPALKPERRGGRLRTPANQDGLF